ncbi:immunoglobulin lambda-1 light chain-like isoform X2 [Taeniopygia guttata]|uniref:immunoglobulin lambda-1 light chain-like isoform X2 n=1 Tax=Taeniopygia guttata TaxID=59729 RepID=UPI003BB9067E
MAWAPLLFVVLAHSTGSLVQAALSQPSSLSAKVGETVRITCSGSSYSYGWYQQKVPGSAPVTVIYYNDKRPSDIPSRFSGSKSGSTGTLTITGVQAEDEAVYFCGSYDSSSTAVFGSGTILTVTGQPQVAPTVHLFAPSSEELSQGKATVVCLIENFYPRDVSVEWVADGKTITSGVETSQSQQQSNAQQQSSTRYLASSYLSLTPTEWQGYNSVSCKVRHVAGNVEKTLNTSECA